MKIHRFAFLFYLENNDCLVWAIVFNVIKDTVLMNMNNTTSLLIKCVNLTHANGMFWIIEIYGCLTCTVEIASTESIEVNFSHGLCTVQDKLTIADLWLSYGRDQYQATNYGEAKQYVSATTIHHHGP